MCAGLIFKLSTTASAGTARESRTQSEVKAKLGKQVQSRQFTDAYPTQRRFPALHREMRASFLVAAFGVAAALDLEAPAFDAVRFSGGAG